MEKSVRVREGAKGYEERRGRGRGITKRWVEVRVDLMSDVVEEVGLCQEIESALNCHYHSEY